MAVHRRPQPVLARAAGAAATVAEGRAETILAEREIKLAEARQARKNRRQDKALTAGKEDAILHLCGAPTCRESLMTVRLLSNSR